MLEEVRRRRAELHEAMSALEQALAAPAPGRELQWAQRVHVALVELSADFRDHVDITEAPDGLYDEVRKSTPRLAGAVDRLTREHVAIKGRVDDLLSAAAKPERPDIDGIRDSGTTLVGKLAHHRQRGSDLLYEAYESDIGGET